MASALKHRKNQTVLVPIAVGYGASLRTRFRQVLWSAYSSVLLSTTKVIRKDERSEFHQGLGEFTAAWLSQRTPLGIRFSDFNRNALAGRLAWPSGDHEALMTRQADDRKSALEDVGGETAKIKGWLNTEVSLGKSIPDISEFQKYFAVFEPVQWSWTPGSIRSGRLFSTRH